MEKTKFNQNQSVFKVGELPDKMYLLVKGSVGIFLPTNETNKPNFIIQENELFGEMGVIDKSLRAGRADALSDANLIKISQYEFNDKLSKSDPFITGLTRVLVTRIRGLLKKTTTQKNVTNSDIETANQESDS